MAKPNLKFLSLWAINDRLELVSLKEQLDELQASGLEGVICVSGSNGIGLEMRQAMQSG